MVIMRSFVCVYENGAHLSLIGHPQHLYITFECGYTQPVTGKKCVLHVRRAGGGDLQLDIGTIGECIRNRIDRRLALDLSNLRDAEGQGHKYGSAVLQSSEPHRLRPSLAMTLTTLL